MSKRENKSKKRLSLKNPCYISLDPKDQASINHYKRGGAGIANIMLGGRPQLSAILETEYVESGKAITRVYRCDETRERRYSQKREEYNVLSLDKEIEDKGEIAAPEEDLADIVANKIIKEALWKALAELNEEEMLICNMIMDGLSQRKRSEALQMPRRTLRDHEEALFAKLRKVLSPYM